MFKTIFPTIGAAATAESRPRPVDRLSRSWGNWKHHLIIVQRDTVTSVCVMGLGKEDVARGVAKIVDRSTNARLKVKVSFIRFFGLRVLARTPTLDDVTMETNYGILEKNGYKVGAFEVSPQ